MDPIALRWRLDKQVELVSRAFDKPIEISDWRIEDHGEVHIQCARLAFTECRFMMGGKMIDSWQPMRPSTWSWGPFWRHRSSAVTVRSSSLGRSMVGTGSVHHPRSHPVNTVGFSN
jgi:hypothetical protein